MVSHLALNIGTLSQDLGHELSRGDKLFIGPKHNIYTFFMILFGLFDLIPIIICQLTWDLWNENERSLFKKYLKYFPEQVYVVGSSILMPNNHKRFLYRTRAKFHEQIIESRSYAEVKHYD